MALLGTQGKRIQAARSAKGMSQAELAQDVDVAEKTVSKWENDRQKPDESKIAAIAKTLGVAAQWIRYGDDDERPGSSLHSAPQGLPKSVRVFMHTFLLELAEADVSDREIEEARRSLTSPENYTFYVGGNPVEYSEEDALMGVQAFALAIRGILRDRGYKKLKAK